MKKRKIKRVLLRPKGSTVEDRMKSLDLDYAYFERQLEIDKDHLDDALVGQPSLMAKVGAIYAEVVSIRDGLKDQFERSKAFAEIDVRERTNEHMNEGEIKARATLDPRRRKAAEKYARACGEAERWDNMQSAFRDRGYALKTLAELWSFGYFANSSAGGRASAEMQEDSIKRRREAMAEKRNSLRRERKHR